MAQTPELLDANTDERHGSYLAAVEGQQLHELRPRVAKELLHLDNRWLDRLYFVFFYGMNVLLVR
jgi:hypothetical protein